MTVISRKVRATPVRSASETWKTIALLLAPDQTSSAHAELMSITGVACSLISSDAFGDAAVVCSGSDPRVRVYCLYGDDAITGDEANESPFQRCPTRQDWYLSLPCPNNDLEWVDRALKEKSDRISARDMTEKLGPQKTETSPSTSGSSNVKAETFLAP